MPTNVGFPVKSATGGPTPFPVTLEMTVVHLEAMSLTVPTFLVDCFAFVSSLGETEGIFRVSGSARRIKDMSADFTAYRDWLYAEKPPQVHDVCGVIKTFLRDYLTSINGMFTPAFKLSLSQLYTLHQCKDSTASTDSCPSAFSMLSEVSTLPSISELHETPSVCEPTELDLAQFILSAVRLLITKNSAKRNELFLYLLHVFNGLLKLQDVTKMTPENFSIIIQPYLFSSSSLFELLTPQEMLTIFITNLNWLLEDYAKNYKILGGLDDADLEIDSMSAASLYSPSKTASTDFSFFQQSPTNKLGGEPARRFSISQKFISFWETYNLPFYRGKQFLFALRHSDKSNEDLSHTSTVVCPHECDKSAENLDKMFSLSKEGGRKCSRLQLPPMLALDLGQLEIPKRSSTCKQSRLQSIAELLRSGSTSKLRNRSASSAPALPKSRTILNTKSVDNLLLLEGPGESSPEKRNFLGRRLSMWVRKA
ncbi:Rho GTPase activation protein [Metschnikowia bicuspidata]|uniref:Rho GTPase activation protein n=1 Tax=Metschnikowia bicuspidata TaxID=27322 RepID=A0A4P9ZKI9_9ASCO|nr:Rho GTPase activation protein [Metschnikowia bicuspidata]